MRVYIRCVECTSALHANIRPSIPELLLEHAPADLMVLSFFSLHGALAKQALLQGLPVWSAVRLGADETLRDINGWSMKDLEACKEFAQRMRK